MKWAVFVVMCLSAVIAPADEKRKVAEQVPLAHFASSNGKLTSNDLLRVFIVAKNVNLGYITNLSDLDLTNSLLRPLITNALVDMTAFQSRVKNPVGPYSTELLKDREIGYEWGIELPKIAKDYFRLRRKWEDLPKKADDAEAAKFGYNRDFEKQESIWKAQGAAGLLFKSTDTFGWLEQPAFLPSVAFDRVSGGDEEDQSDQLELRTALDATLVLEKSGQDVIQSVLLRATPVYQTDFSFDTERFGADAEIEPISELWKIGDGFKLPWHGDREVITFLPRLFLHFEGGEVTDAGSNTNISKGDSYLRLGPVVELQVKPGRSTPPAWQKLEFNTRWQHYETLTSESPKAALFSQKMSYKIAKAISLEIEYRRGRLPISAKRVESIDIGLGLKF